MANGAIERFMSQFDSFSRAEQFSLLAALKKRMALARPKINSKKSSDESSFIIDDLIGIIPDRGQTARSVREERLTEHETFD